MRERKKEEDNAEFAENAEIAEKRNPRTQAEACATGMVAGLKTGHYMG
jgi:hypothetical protein